MRALLNGGDPAKLNMSRTTFTITQEGPQCCLTLELDELTTIDTAPDNANGWLPPHLSGPKDTTRDWAAPADDAAGEGSSVQV